MLPTVRAGGLGEATRVRARQVIVAGLAAGLAVGLLAGCGGSAAPADAPAAPTPSGAASTGSLDACARPNLTTITATGIAVGATRPARAPWFADEDPENGKGYASALAYALADELGFAHLEVQWALERGSVLPLLAPQEPRADLAIADMPIQDSVASPVASSDPYYAMNQALIVRSGSPLAGVPDVAGLRDARLAAVGDDAVAFVESVLSPREPVTPMTAAAAVSAVRSGRMDGVVVDLPQAQEVLASGAGLAMAGQFEPAPDATAYGLVLAQGNPLVLCVNRALAALAARGELDALRDRWLAAPNPRVIGQ